MKSMNKVRLDVCTFSEIAITILQLHKQVVNFAKFITFIYDINNIWIMVTYRFTSFMAFIRIPVAPNVTKTMQSTLTCQDLSSR
jgi:hypothetical protein